MVRVLTSDITDEVVSVGAIVLGKVNRIVQFTRPAAVRHIISAFVVIVHPLLPWIVVFLLGVGGRDLSGVLDRAAEAVVLDAHVRVAVVPFHRPGDPVALGLVVGCHYVGHLLGQVDPILRLLIL